MQERAVSSVEAQDALRDAQNRLMVLSGVYDKLPGSNGAGLHVELRGLIESLVRALVRNSPKAGRLEVQVDCVDLSLDVTTATSLAMIVNEAVTNALKYAFETGGPGKLRVQLSTAANECLLLISDNGSGFEQPLREGSLGMRLMKGMARQLEGRLSIDGSKGTTVSLRCPLRTSPAATRDLRSDASEFPAIAEERAATLL